MIKGLTDRRSFFPRLGKIRLGVRTEGGGFPKDTDHFVVTDFPEIVKVYGAKPKRLIVSFPANDIETVFPSRLENWRSRKPREGDPAGATRNVLFCSGDGETANRMYIGERDAHGHPLVMKMAADERPELGEMFSMPCPYTNCPYYEQRQCRETGRLNFVLPEVTFKGTYQIETSSLYGFGNILDTLRWVLKMSADQLGFPNGRLAGAFFYLSRIPQSMTPEELKGKTIIKHVLALEVIDEQAMVEKLGAMTPPWLRHGAVKALDPATDHPDELFPDRVMPSLPAAQEPPDELVLMASEAGLGKAEYELLAVKLGGDVDKIQAHLLGLLNKKDIDEAIPVTPPAAEEPKPASPAAAPKDKQPSLMDW